MHIAVLSDPENFHTQKWSLALQRAGAEVTIFSFSDYEFSEVPCVRIKPRYLANGQITYASYLYTTDRLRRAMIRHKVDIANPLNITPFGVWATRSGFKPIASVAMGADILEYPPPWADADIPFERTWNSVETPGWLSRSLYKWKWQFFRRQVKLALDKSHYITGDNLQLVHAIRDWFGIAPRRVHLNRWGIEEELFEVSEAQREALRQKFDIRPWQRVILSPRGVKPIYQGDIILDAFEMLLRRGVRDLKLVAFSAGYEIPDKIEAQAQVLEENFPNFHFVRQALPRREVLAFWSLVDAFISAPVYDGYSNALSEGRYIGAIPLVNAIPANLELIEHDKNGWVIEPFTPEHIADAILELAEHIDHYKQKFAPENRDWILANSHLDTNVKRFVKDCKKVVHDHRMRKRI